MYVHYLPSLLHALNLPRPLSILFQMSFLRVLSLLTGHSISCKPSLSTNIPLIIKYFFCCEPSVSIQPNLSNEHCVSDVCKTEPLQEHCVLTKPLSIPCMTDLLSIASCICSWVAERFVVSEPSVSRRTFLQSSLYIHGEFRPSTCMFTVLFDAVPTHMHVILAQLSTLCAHLLVFVVQC